VFRRTILLALLASAVLLMLGGRAQQADASASGVPLPIGNIPGWRQAFADDFTKNAALGSFGTSSSTAIVYSGDHGGKWTTYPDGWPCEAYTQCYEPRQVLSVHNGVLDYWLHDCTDGKMCGATLVPQLPIGTNGTLTPFLTYGRYTARFRVVFGDANHLSEIHVAWMFWPKNGADSSCAESDFPESSPNLSTATLAAFDHYGCATKAWQGFWLKGFDWTQWHTYTQAWGPTYRRYYIDGKLLGTSARTTYAKPETFLMQVEAHDKRIPETGHLLVDWAAEYTLCGTCT
jgi:hypothetical protein